MNRNKKESITAMLPGMAHGASEGCPFCRASRRDLPVVGTRFRRLSGFEAGRNGIVVQSPAPAPLPPDEFLAHMDGDPRNYQRRILSTDIIELLPSPEPPSWALPVELHIAAELDRAVVAFCEARCVAGGWIIDWTAFYEIIRWVWSKRLPIEAGEIWGILKAHGTPDAHHKEIAEFFHKGRDLLVYAAGKKPVKKYRVQPLAVSMQARR